MRSVAVLCLPILMTAAAALAQPPAGGQPSKAPPPPTFTSAPPIEDRNLYYAFFNAQQALFAGNQAAKNANPGGAVQIDQQAATLLHITVQDLPTVTNLVQQAAQSYAQVPTVRQSHVASGNLKLTPAQLEGLDDFLRLRITVRTVLSLAQQLPPTSWASLHSYIIGDFKKAQLASQPKP
jgi:hypothetical protein